MLEHDAVNRTREGMKKRIAWLNKKHCKTAKELADVMKELGDAQIEYIKESVVAVVIECVNRYAVALTPVDTGRARAGWFISGESSEWKPETIKRPKGSTGIMPEYAQYIKNNVPDINRLSESDVIHVMNNVEYILALDAGWSKQQPSGFIERFLTETKNLLLQIAQQAKQ